jgi:tubulin--tyrosine ligase
MYLGRGNNCMLVRGLMKRRFWWTIVDRLTEEVNFVWTQLKLPEYF